MKRMVAIGLMALILVAVLVAGVIGCEKENPMGLTSSAFTDGGVLPVKYTVDAGFDKVVSPPLCWSDVSMDTKSFALLMVDLDAPAQYGVMAHWMVYDIESTVRQFQEGSIPKGAKYLPNFYAQYGMPAFANYGPPWPPASHRYQFTLYALNIAEIVFPTGAGYVEFQAVVDLHTIEKAELTAVYGPALTPQPGS
jgi:Raf kinase inhibitor-like YbhB/YbcL family protein